MKLYDFMDMEIIDQLETAVEYADYFIRVKQDILIKLDAVNWSIMNCKLRYEEQKAKILLEENFKELYGKDNESIRNSHIRKLCGELLESLEDYKYRRNVYLNQLDTLNDMISINSKLVADNKCHCKDGE